MDELGGFRGVWGGVLNPSIRYSPRKEKFLYPLHKQWGYGGMEGLYLERSWGLGGLSCSTGDAWSRWSHMCGSWYLPRFLFSLGS